MIGKTSMHCGKKINKHHNHRTYDETRWNKDKHIDKARTHLNIYADGDGNLKNFFDKRFGDALLKFNEKNYKKHPERVIGMSQRQITIERKKLEQELGEGNPKIEKKLEKIKREKAVTAYFKEHKKDAQEVIIQMSDAENFTNLIKEKGFDKAIEIHKEFLNRALSDWKENNPNFEIFDWAIHFDESTPHLHLDFVPIIESDKGLTTKISLEGALKEKGLIREKNQAYSETPYKRWRAEQSLRLDKIASDYMTVIPNEPSTKDHIEYYQNKYQVTKEKGIQKLIDAFKKKPTIELAEKIIENEYDLNRVLASEGRKEQERAKVELLKVERAKKSAEMIIQSAEVTKARQDERDVAQDNREKQLNKYEERLKHRELNALITERTQAERVIRQYGDTTAVIDSSYYAQQIRVAYEKQKGR